MSLGTESRRIFQEKTSEELKEQHENVEILFEMSLLPAEYAEDTAEIMGMHTHELKEKFPERYRIYLELLREYRRMEKDKEQKYTQADVKAMQRRLAMMNNLDRHVEEIKGGEDTHLREHQVNVFDDLRDFMERGENSGYVELPTGSGKTVIFVELLRVLGVPALIVVPTKNLVVQTRDSINTFAKDLQAGAVYQKAKDYDANVVVTTYASLKKVMEHDDFDLDRIGVVILDEAHESLSQKRTEIVNDLKQYAMVMGFTATSEYSDIKNVAGLLGEEIHSMTLREAIEKRAIAPCSAMVAKTRVDISKVRVANTGDFDPEELDKAINVPARNKAAARLAAETFADKQKIVFCATVKHAENIAQEIRDAGQTAEVIVGETQDAIEKKYQDLGYGGGWKEAYAKGDIKTVLSASLLTRGTDLPSAEVCINAVPTRSLVNATQRGGRVTRLDPNNPDKHAIVVDIFDAGEMDGEEDRQGNKPVLFFKILGGSSVVPSGSEGTGESGGGTDRDGGRVSKDIGIEDFEMVVDLEEMERLVYGQKEESLDEKQEEYRNLIKAKFTAKQWVEMTKKEKEKIKINNKGLEAISSIFGIKGNPINSSDVHIALGHAIYGKDVIDAFVEKELSVEEYRNLIKVQFTAQQWVEMTKKEKGEIKINNKGLRAISRIFGIKGNPIGYHKVHIALGRKIYGDKAIDDALANE